MTVSRLLKEADSREIAGWMAYTKIEDERESKKKAGASENLLKARLTAAGQHAARKTKGGG